MNDTTYVFRQNVDNYQPFSSNNDNNDYNDKFEQKFCPVCHYNLKSAEHRKLCGNTIPIGDCVIPLIVMLSIYIIIKFIKINYYDNIWNKNRQ